MTSIDYRLFVTILLERLKVVKDKHVSVFLWHKKKGHLQTMGFTKYFILRKAATR